MTFASENKMLQMKTKSVLDSNISSLGCVDGSLIPIKDSLIPIQALSTREDVYICRKGYHALKVQGTSDSRKKFTNLPRICTRCVYLESVWLSNIFKSEPAVWLLTRSGSMIIN